MDVEQQFEKDDEELLAEIAGGERQALQSLYERHAGWITLRLSRRCLDHDVVDQAVQDTFLAVWRQAGSYSGQGAVGGWLWGIAIRQLIGKMRRLAPRLVGLIMPDSDGSEPSAEEQVLIGVQYGDLGGALNRLSPELRMVIQATVLDGLTVREAARLLHLPVGTVKTRLMRARSQLREELA